MTSVEDFNTPEKSTGTRRPATSFIVMSSNAESKKLKLDQLGELKDKTTSETSATLYFRSDMSSKWQKMNDQEYSSSGKKTTSFSNSKTQQRVQISKSDDGKFHVRGLLAGQQLMVMKDGTFQMYQNKNSTFPSNNLPTTANSIGEKNDVSKVNQNYDSNNKSQGDISIEAVSVKAFLAHRPNFEDWGPNALNTPTTSTRTKQDFIQTKNNSNLNNQISKMDTLEELNKEAKNYFLDIKHSKKSQNGRKNRNKVDLESRLVTILNSHVSELKSEMAKNLEETNALLNESSGSILKFHLNELKSDLARHRQEANSINLNSMQLHANAKNEISAINEKIPYSDSKTLEELKEMKTSLDFMNSKLNEDLSVIKKDMETQKKNAKKLKQLKKIKSNLNIMKSNVNEDLSVIKKDIETQKENTKSLQELNEMKSTLDIMNSKVNEDLSVIKMDIETQNENAKTLQEFIEMKSTLDIMNSKINEDLSGIKKDIEIQKENTRLLNKTITESDDHSKCFDEISSLKVINEKLTKEISDLKTTLKVLRNNSESTNDLQALEEVERLKKQLDEANAKISSNCIEYSSTLERNQELVQENSRLITQCKDKSTSMEKIQQNLENFEEKWREVNEKLKLQYSKGELLQNQMNTLMQEFLPTETEKTFLNLREEFEYLKQAHTSKKEEIEVLQVQLSNCECNVIYTPE